MLGYKCGDPSQPSTSLTERDKIETLKSLVLNSSKHVFKLPTEL